MAAMVQSLLLPVLLCCFAAGAAGQANFGDGYLACTATCPAGARFLPVGAESGQGCRFGQDCSIAFNIDGTWLSKCEVSSYQQLSSVIKFVPYTFGSLADCNNFMSILVTSQQEIGVARRSRRDKSQTRKAEEAGCSCETVAENILGPFSTAAAFIPDDPTPVGVCTHLIDELLDKLKDKSCSKLDFLPLAGEFCDLVGDVVIEGVNIVLKPVRSVVIKLCSTIVTTVVKMFGLQEVWESFFELAQQYKDNLGTITNSFCGSAICPSSGVSLCTMAARGGRQTLIFNNFVCTLFGGCFSNNSLALDKHGQEVPIKQLRAGDVVQAVDPHGAVIHDQVFRVTHKDDMSPTRFVRLETDFGAFLELSPDHYLHVNKCCDVNELVLADEVNVGDVVFTAKAGGLIETKVKTKSYIILSGAYNVHLLGGNIIVNSIAASHFTTKSTWEYNRWALQWYQVSHSLNQFFKFNG